MLLATVYYYGHVIKLSKNIKKLVPGVAEIDNYSGKAGNFRGCSQRPGTNRTSNAEIPHIL